MYREKNKTKQKSSPPQIPSMMKSSSINHNVMFWVGASLQEAFFRKDVQQTDFKN